MYKMKQKFIYLAFFTGLLFLFLNGRDTNKKTTEKFYSNDYEVHFVVHKTKKAKTENFLERKKKQIQKKVNRLVEKYDKVENNKAGKRILIILLALLFLFLLLHFMSIAAMETLRFTVAASVGASYSAGASAGLGAVFFLFLSLIFVIILITLDKKKKEQQHKG